MSIIYYILLSIILLLIGRFHWRLRHFYVTSWKMPGPLAYPVIGNAYIFRNTSTIVERICRLCDVYHSPIRFWLGYRFMVFVDRPGDLEYFMNAPESMNRGKTSRAIYECIGGHGLFTSVDGEWKMHRRLLNTTMNSVKLLTFYPIINRHIRTLCERLTGYTNPSCGKEFGREFNVYELIDMCTLDIICETLTGIEADIQTSENNELLQGINNLLETIGARMFQPWLHNPLLFRISRYYHSYQTGKQLVNGFITETIKKRRCSNSSGNFIDLCTQLMDEGLFTETDVYSESQTMMAGGFETSALASSYATLMLAMHPDHQTRIYQELVTFYDSESFGIQPDDLNRLPIIDRFVKETLRLFPVAPIVSRSISKDVTYDGYNIPAGTDVILGIYHMQRSQSVWGPNSNEFDPDRFRDTNQIHSYAYVPFGGGWHSCIGSKYGNIVLRILVAWMVWHYEFTTRLTLDDLKFRIDVSLKLINGHLVRIRKRNH